jgi:hypothetical protein
VCFIFVIFIWILEMPKRKKQLAGLQDAIAKRRKTSELVEERLNVPNDDSSSIDAIAVPDATSSLRGEESTPEAEAEAGTNTALPDVATSLSPPITAAIADAATNTAVTALPDVVTSLLPAAVDAEDDADENTDAMMDTQSNYHPRASDPSTSMSGQRVKREPVIKIETTPAPTNPSTSTQEIKLEPVVKIETAPASALANTSTDQAEAPIPAEPVRNRPNLNRTVTVRRKAAKRTDLEPPPQRIVIPLSLSPSPQAEAIPARKKLCVAEPLSRTTDEATRKTTSPDISEGLSSPATPPPITATVNVPTRCRSRRRTKLPLIETSEAQLDDDGGDNDADDSSGPAAPTTDTATVSTSIRRRSSRRVITTSSTGAAILPKSQRQAELSSTESIEAQLDVDDGNDDGPPCTDAVHTWTRRRSRRQILLSSTEISGSQPDDTDDAYIPPNNTVNLPIRRRSSRYLSSTSITGAAILRKSQRMGTVMFLRDAAKTPNWVIGSTPKGFNTGLTKKERNQT